MRRSADVTRPDLSPNARGKTLRQMSVMHIFRDAAEKGDARVDHALAPEAGDRSDQRRARRDLRSSIDEAELRRHIALDLESLTTTIRLDAIVPMSGTSRVARSVINFGFADLSRASGTVRSRDEIADAIRGSLLAFEPRLVPGSVLVERLDGEENDANRLGYRIQAEIAADPADLPLDFVAEVDLGAGKIQTKRLRVQK